MKKLKNLSKKHIYFIGIGGISMSGLAKMCMSLGAKVTGSDEGSGPEIKELSDLGVKIHKEHKAINILDDIDLVVYTVAIKSNNPELMAAKAMGIKTYERAEFLGLILGNYSNVISIAGTHGKTTTTAMIGEIFVQAGLNPTIHIGGKSVNLQTNTLIGGNDYFILEACEYKNSFRFIESTLSVITNIELDHLDYYRDYSHIYQCFVAFAQKSRSVIVDKSLNIKHKSALWLGQDIEMDNIIFSDFGYNFDVYLYDQFYGNFRLNCIGLHNVHNALFAIAVAVKYNIDKETIYKALSEFKGVERRYELIAKENDVPVIIDYAHHPTEIKTSIEGIRGVYSNPLVIFQPHTYSRTLKLFKEFESVLGEVDNLFLYKTYPARESEIPGGRAEDLADAINCVCIGSYENLLSVIKDFTQSKKVDSVIILGAGDIANKLKIEFAQNVYKNK